MMQQNVSSRTHRPTAQQMSNLPIEDQLRVRFANRGLGAVGVNSSRPQQNGARPQPSYARPKQPRPNVETVRKTQRSLASMPNAAPRFST